MSLERIKHLLLLSSISNNTKKRASLNQKLLRKKPQEAPARRPALGPKDLWAEGAAPPLVG